MLYPKEMKRAQELVGEDKVAKEIVPILEREFSAFKALSDSAKLRNVYRWIETKKEVSSTNWIEVYEKKHKERLPIIPEYMLPVVKDKTAIRVSKNMELSTPSAQWWNGQLPSQQEQILQTVDWLCKHNKDWWCKSREDYLDRIKRGIAGHPSDIQAHWKR